MNGLELQLARRELLQVMRHRYFVGFVLLVYFTVLSLRPFSGFLALDVMTATLVFTQGALLFVLVEFGGMFLLDRLGKQIITLPLTVLAAIVTATSVALTGYLLQLGQPTATDLITLYLFHISVFVMGEIIFVSFLLPKVLRDIGIPSEPAAVAPIASPNPKIPEPQSGHRGLPSANPADLILFGHRISPKDLWLIKAEEHYVALETRQGRVLLRGRISEAENALPDDLGLRVHRSYWVASHALASLEQARDQWQLVLHSGAEIPVARSRRKETRDWAERILG